MLYYLDFAMRKCDATTQYLAARRLRDEATPGVNFPPSVCAQPAERENSNNITHIIYRVRCIVQHANTKYAPVGVCTVHYSITTSRARATRYKNASHFPVAAAVRGPARFRFDDVGRRFSENFSGCEYLLPAADPRIGEKPAPSLFPQSNIFILS